MWLFYSFAALLLLQSLLSLRGGVRYLRFFRRELSRPPADFAPFATVVVPCRGVDQGLRENLRALFVQDYPAYELIFVADAADDLSLAVVEGMMREFATSRGGGAAQPNGAAGAAGDARPPVAARVIVAGAAEGRGQKVHNLCAAVRQTDPASEIFVFVDTDARPRRDWLRSLVAPLADPRAGAATGYRWFVPVRAGTASHLRSVWNASIASALGENERSNFCWGGSTAVRRETFERMDVLAEWRGALSDDYALTRALQRAGLPIRFVPRCLVASREDCTWRQLVEFTTRQLKITRVYAPHLWRLVLVSNLLFTLVFFGGLALAAAGAFAGRTHAAACALLAAIYLIGSGKAYLRLRAVSEVFARGGERLGAGAWLAHLALWPAASALFAFNAVAAGASRRIKWRGITYELKSPDETVIIAREEGNR
jgi:cellulose synthase/poly-beta-1,6-N-acetylglucosamine synthase-like glycosyltransferase